MLQDLRQACGLFRRRPAAALLCTVTLAIGIAAFTAIISIADAVLWHPLPYANADQLVRIREYFPRQHQAALTVPLDMLQEWDAKRSLFESVDAFYLHAAWLPGAPAPDAVTGAVVAPSLFQALGVVPELGRLPATDDRDSVLISDALWKSRFAGDPAVVGKTLRVGDRTFTIAGVMPADFSFPVRNVGIWTPLLANNPPLQVIRRVEAIARLKPGVSLAAAQAAAAATVHGEHPGLAVTPFAIVWRPPAPAKV
ncbi:MAG TPA: ABC transporter permease [Vicinamibacterales bacterium]|nr:ABC transporter permease [Vicinamibacterales bacterium]